jgi:ataxia telangiectasia mutated family protein
MDILANYFNPATALITNAVNEHHDSADASYAAVYHQCALFAEHQHHAILKSPDLIRYKVYVDRKTREVRQFKEEIVRLSAQPSASNLNQVNQLKNSLGTVEKVLKEDEISYGQNNRNRDTFLQEAIDMYSRCLEVSDNYDDDSTIRLCSLWFANYDDVPMQDKIKEALDRIPSRKFVFLSHQLSARLASIIPTQPQKSQKNLQRLLLRMCKEHPFHTLYQVFCLLPERASQSAAGHANRRISGHDSPASQADRASAASDIFNRLKNDPVTRQRAVDVERICEASLQWAKHPIKNSLPKNRKGPFKIPEQLLIRQITFTNVPVVTIRTPVDPTLLYDNCIWIAKYEATYDTAGGINLPKINTCLGSDGLRYKQLVCCYLRINVPANLTVSICSSRVRVTMILDKTQ